MATMKIYVIIKETTTMLRCNNMASHKYKFNVMATQVS